MPFKKALKVLNLKKGQGKCIDLRHLQRVICT